MKKYGYVSILGLLVFLSAQFVTFYPTDPNFRAYFLDVGQGDSILLRYPSGEHMLVDTGKDSKVFRELDKVLPWYDKTIEYILLTHSDLDHVGAMLDILDRYSVRKLFINEFFTQEDIGQKIVTKAKLKGTEIEILKQGDILTFGTQVSNSFTILNQKSDFFFIYKNTNDCSLVGLARYGSSTILLTGDIGKEVERSIVPSIIEPITILKVAHHGSKNSSDTDFIQKIKPQYSIVSVGQNNYGHPTPEALATLRSASSTIWTTKEDATIVASSDGKVLNVSKLFDQTSFFQSSVCSILLYGFDTSC
jgi:competence protein ComEC